MQIQQEEIWKTIPGYDGAYLVSNKGNVKSLKGLDDVLLKQKISNSGYYTVNLRFKNQQKTITVHQLVAMAFLNHKPCGYEIVIDHINNVRTDNHLENLQLTSSRINISKDRGVKTSRYTGVHWSNKAKKWESTINIKKNRIFLGYYETEEVASSVYNKALENMDKYDNNNKEFSNFISKELKIIKKEKTSEYLGVHFDKKRNKWVSSIFLKSKTISLGYFNNEKNAAKFYEIALKNKNIFNGDTSFFKYQIRQKFRQLNK